MALIEELGAPPRFGTAWRELKRAQKSGRGAPPYSLYVNRPLGRVLAAGAYRAGRTPDQVTVISALITFTGLAVLGLGPSTPLTGVVVALLLVLGYALDAADGQLARLRGGGSLSGEWLDHMVDAVKVVALHLVVLVHVYRVVDIAPVWLLVPLGFAVVSSVHFFGMVLVDAMARIRRAEQGRPTPPVAPAQRVVTALKLPTDYGVLCLAMVVLGFPAVFLPVYTVLAAATAGYTVLVVGKWRRDVLHLESGSRP